MKDFDKLQKMLDSKMEELELKANKENYQAIELRLTDDKGCVLIKGTMKVGDMMKLQELQGMGKGEIMQMLYFSLEDELKFKKSLI